jgi:hypothetical protein
MTDSVPVRISTIYMMRCETIDFASRNEPLVLAVFPFIEDRGETASRRPDLALRRVKASWKLLEKVTPKRSQGLGIVSARNFVRRSPALFERLQSLRCRAPWGCRAAFASLYVRRSIFFTATERRQYPNGLPRRRPLSR